MQRCLMVKLIARPQINVQRRKTRTKVVFVLKSLELEYGCHGHFWTSHLVDGGGDRWMWSSASGAGDAMASRRGPQVGSSCIPGLWNVTLITLDFALKLQAYVSPPSVLYNVWIGRLLDIPGTETLSTSSWAHVLVAPNVSE